LLDAAEFAHSRGARVAAVGCLVERYRAELVEEVPEVDLWCGLDTRPLVATLAAAESCVTAARTTRRARPVHAFIKVSDGCDRHCSFCAIPLIKGEYEIVPAGTILSAAREALAQGARELVLVGQDTSRWQQPGWGGLHRLLAALKALEPAPVWLRLLYLQPEHITDPLLEALAEYAVPYIDVPLQHASGTVLRRMRRAGDGESYLRLLAHIRTILPGAALRSTFITGFPGETEEDFEELLRFVDAAGLSAAGVFPFDAQEGTHAAALPNQVPSPLALERAGRLGLAIDEAAARFWQGLEGRRLDVLVERGTRRRDGVAVGRCALQAPDVDGRTFVKGKAVRRGQQTTCVVTGTAGYDVEGTVRSTPS
jgi:ribosomal protein S12 methylthiotransferase